MNQLTGKYVNVVLSVECGRGMNFLRNKVFITANFNNRILESDHIPPEESPPFNTELVWEIEKKELRKIRCGNLPLRVECITVDSQGRKERIGFTLLSLRSAQIIPQSIAQQPATPVWHKLIGCQADKRKSHPELFLSLSLRDHMFNDQLNIECNNGGMPFIVEEDTHPNGESVEQKEYPIKYFENGHIQIGVEIVAKKSYTFNVKIINVYNLDALLPESLVFQTNSSNYFLTFKILGIIIKTKPFENQIYGNITLNERIVVNLLSTKDILEEFFKTETISISFYYGYDKLGVAKLNFDNVWNKNDEKHFFKFPSPDGVVPFGLSDKSPYITLQTWIEENDETKKKETKFASSEEIPEKPKARSIFSNVCKKLENEIDTGSTHNTEEPVIHSPRFEITEKSLIPTITKSVDTVVLNEPLTARSSAVLDLYEKFIILVRLKYLIWTAPPPDTKIMFKFLHPRANSCTTIFTEISNEVHKEISLNNLYVRIAYISTADKIAKLLKYWQPKLVLADANEEYITNQRPINIDCLEIKSKDLEIEFTNSRNSSQLAKIGLNVNINIVDSGLEDDHENLFLLPVILDEIITVQEVSDLDKWKEEERKRFQSELEKVKLNEIERLENVYEEKKNDLEVKVSKTFEKCKNIQEQLKNKIISMKFNKQFETKQTNGQTLYDNIFRENLKYYSLANSEEVIELLSKTQRDNILLKEMCEQQKKEISNITESTVTKAQTNSLLLELKILEEKFTEARVAKSYFTQQLQKACLVHDPETEDLNTTIKKGKERLSKFKSKSRERHNTLQSESYQGFYTEQIRLE